MSQLPEGWKLVQLGDIVKFSNGKGHEQYIDDNGEYIVVNSKFISTNGEVKKYSNENLSSLKSGDIAMVMSDIPNGKALAKCFLVNEDNKYTLNQRICSLQPKIDDNIFLFYKLNRNNYFMKFNDGVSQTNLRKNEVLECPIELPPLEEQKKIADILSTVDQKIAFVEDNISQTEELKKGLRQELFCNGIGHSDFNDTEFGKRPESWKIEKLGDLTSLTAGGTPSTKIEEYWTPQEVPWLSSGEVNKKIVFDTDNMISEEGLNNSAAKLVSKNSVLMGLAGQGKTRGTVAITETELSTNQSVASILPSEDLDMYFIYHNLDSRYEEIRAMSTGVGGRGGLNLAILRSIKIALPPLEEQKQIANILKIVDQKLEVLKDKKESFEKLKKGLMQKLLTGEVRV